MKYFCYYNLHKHVFSLKNVKTGLVDKSRYTNTVKIENCTLKVSQSGRQKVLKEKRKNVHAGIVGNVLSTDESLLNDDLEGYTELTYNPYLYDSFVVKETGKPVKTASVVYLLNKKIFAIGIDLC